jgi:hypothetical protein
MRYQLHGVNVSHGEIGARSGLRGFPASFAYLHARHPVLDHGQMTSGEGGAWLYDGPMGALGGINGLCLQSIAMDGPVRALGGNNGLCLKFVADGWPFGGILVVAVALLMPASVPWFSPRIRGMSGCVVMSTQGCGRV